MSECRSFKKREQTVNGIDRSHREEARCGHKHAKKEAYKQARTCCTEQQARRCPLRDSVSCTCVWQSSGGGRRSCSHVTLATPRTYLVLYFLSTSIPRGCVAYKLLADRLTTRLTNKTNDNEPAEMLELGQLVRLVQLAFEPLRFVASSSC